VRWTPGTDNLYENARPLSVSEFCAQLQEGDALFWTGVAPRSRIMQWATFSEWSHVGIVVVEERTATRLFFESVSDAGGTPLVDALSGTAAKSGPREVHLAEKLRTYAGGDDASAMYGPGWRTLPVGVMRMQCTDRKRFTLEFAKFRSLAADKNYVREQAVLMRAAYSDVLGSNGQGDRDAHGLPPDYFCSQLVVDAYKHCRIAPASAIARDCTPASLVRTGGFAPRDGGAGALGPRVYVVKVAVPPAHLPPDAAPGTLAAVVPLILAAPAAATSPPPAAVSLAVASSPLFERAREDVDGSETLPM
jgi:hypothetical protein